jgi:hypothetical protein
LTRITGISYGIIQRINEIVGQRTASSDPPCACGSLHLSQYANHTGIFVGIYIDIYRVHSIDTIVTGRLFLTDVAGGIIIQIYDLTADSEQKASAQRLCHCPLNKDKRNRHIPCYEKYHFSFLRLLLMLNHIHLLHCEKNYTLRKAVN